MLEVTTPPAGEAYPNMTLSMSASYGTAWTIARRRSTLSSGAISWFMAR